MSLSFNEYVNLPVTMSARLAIAWPRRLCLFYPCMIFIVFPSPAVFASPDCPDQKTGA